MRDKMVSLTVANGMVIPTVDTGSTGLMDAASDAMTASAVGYTNMTVTVIQVTDAGTATLIVEASYDGGVSYAPITGSPLSEASFAAANNAGVALGLSDARGMALQPTHVRTRLTAVSGGGTYSMSLTGQLLGEYR